MENKIEFLCAEFGLSIEDILNVYRYGSRVYGCHTELSDEDFVIVCKKSILPSGAFRDNAKSSKDGKTQMVMYSRSGFLDAIDNYEPRSIECVFAPQEHILQKKMDFKIRKPDTKTMIKKYVEYASHSWHIAHECYYKYEQVEQAKKGAYHSLRILLFGLQLKNNSAILNFGTANALRAEIFANVDFDIKKYDSLKKELIEKLRM